MYQTVSRDTPRTGTTAVITGGARGFGKAFGEALAAEGAHTVLVDLDAAGVESAARGICASGGTAYGTSKLAVAGLTITFARELGTDGIRINAISPGMILTDTIRAELPETTKAQVKAMQFIAADGAEMDIVEAMLFLTSGRARFITGETLRVTGGMAAGV